MSVKDINKILFIYSALTGELIYTMPKEDFIKSGYARDYFFYKIEEIINNGEGIIIKEGYKS